MTGTSRDTVRRVVKEHKQEQEAAKTEGRDPLPPSKRPKKPKPPPEPEPEGDDLDEAADAVLEVLDAYDLKASEILLAVLDKRPTLKAVLKSI